METTTQARRRGSRRWSTSKLAIGIGILAISATAAIAARGVSGWGAPVSAEKGSHPELNTAFNDGCPILSPDGLALYMASNRPGGLGGQDIWVSYRRNTRQGWGQPVNLGSPVNSTFDDFCPTPGQDNRLFFVSRRDEANGDVYVTRQNGAAWAQPVSLGPNINSSAQEWSPSHYIDDQGRDVLYFASTRPGGLGGQDIYYSVNYGPAQPAPGDLNTVFDDARPNVSSNGREIVFDSNRTGALGLTDIYTAARLTTSDPWPSAIHLAAQSSAAVESRASLSWDGSYLLFGSTREGGEGQADIYVAKRSQNGGRPR